jgi:hypothetical protein
VVPAAAAAARDAVRAAHTAPAMAQLSLSVPHDVKLWRAVREQQR